MAVVPVQLASGLRGVVAAHLLPQIRGGVSVLAVPAAPGLVPGSQVWPVPPAPAGQGTRAGYTEPVVERPKGSLQRALGSVVQ